MIIKDIWHSNYNIVEIRDNSPLLRLFLTINRLILKDTFLIGRKPVLDAIQASSSIEKVWIDKSLKGDIEKDIRALCRTQQIPLQYVPKEKLNDLCSSATHQGVVAQVGFVEYISIEQVLPHLYESGKVPFVLVLDGIEDVRNIGGLARSAVWFDADAIVVSIKKTARINSFAMKASAGALNDIHFCREKTIGGAVEYLKNSGLQIVVADGNAPDTSSSIKFDEPIALVMGSESKGVSYALTQMADATISIPGSKRVESLNVSNAGAILMYEIFKNKI